MNYKNTFIYLVGKLFYSLKNGSSSSFVICYHSISNSKDKYSVEITEFKKQILEISKYFSFVSLDEITDKSKRLKPAVSLTFDDGYRDVLKVKGFLKENNIPATIFVLSDPKSVNREELDNDRELLSIHEVKKLKDEGWTIGCHSATHANFLELDKTAVQKEIYTAKANLEKAIGTEIKYFAYPKGVNSRKLQNAVNNAGYFAAFTANPGIVEKSTNIFALPRFVMEKKNIFQIPYSFTEIVDQFRKARGITYAN